MGKTTIVRHRALRTSPLSGAALGLAAASSPAAAAPAADATAVQELVVTANRREERLQDVPIAVTALSGDTLQAASVNEPLKLTQVVPGLTFGVDADAFTSARVYYDFSNRVSQPPYEIVNGEIGWMRHSGTEVSVWGRNLTNTPTSPTSRSATTATAHTMRPRLPMASPFGRPSNRMQTAAPGEPVRRVATASKRGREFGAG